MKTGNKTTETDIFTFCTALSTCVDTIVRDALERIEAERPATGRRKTGPALLGRKKAAEYIAVSPSTLDRLRSDGKIKAVLIQGVRKYAIRDLDKHIDHEREK